MELKNLVSDVCAELSRRGVSFREADVFGFVNAAQPSDDTADEFADGWQEAHDQEPAALLVAKVDFLCQTLAQQIEIAGIENDVPFCAGQNQYGVSWEYLVNGEWFDHDNLTSGIEKVSSARFFDCDGERSGEATDVCEILEAAKNWIKVNESYYPEEAE